jgi:hypothetical protein
MQHADSRPIVVVHTNDQQMAAALVGAHSLKSRSRNPGLFDVRLLRLEETPYLWKRHKQTFTWWEGGPPTVWLRNNMLSFAPLRRMVPQLLGYRGRALVLDPDIFAVGDVYELLTRDMRGKAILCRPKQEWREGRQLISSAVMLLDCARLTEWQWDREMDDLFAGRASLGPLLSLWDVPAEKIGLLEEEWNHPDTLTEQTKLLHTTAPITQPWKTGLPADFNEYTRASGFWLDLWKRGTSRLLGEPDRTVRYRPHPDPRQEQLFFSLLRECLEQGGVTAAFLRKAMRRNWLRKDAFERIGAAGQARGASS